MTDRKNYRQTTVNNRKMLSIISMFSHYFYKTKTKIINLANQVQTIQFNNQSELGLRKRNTHSRCQARGTFVKLLILILAVWWLGKRHCVISYWLRGGAEVWNHFRPLRSPKATELLEIPPWEWTNWFT